MNYARHVQTKEVRFFSGEAPMPAAHLELWAFWALPTGHMFHTFQGRLIGESSDMRLERITGQKQLSYKKASHS